MEGRITVDSLRRPDKTGWLLVPIDLFEDEIIAHKRYCVLQDDCLYYFKNCTPGVPLLGCMKLCPNTICEQSGTGISKYHSFNINTPQKSYRLRSEHLNEAQDWQENINFKVSSMRSF